MGKRGLVLAGGKQELGEQVSGAYLLKFQVVEESGCLWGMSAVSVCLVDRPEMRFLQCVLSHFSCV